MLATFQKNLEYDCLPPTGNRSKDKIKNKSEHKVNEGKDKNKLRSFILQYFTLTTKIYHPKVDLRKDDAIPDIIVLFPSIGPTQSSMKVWDQCEEKSLYFLSNSITKLHSLSLTLLEQLPYRGIQKLYMNPLTSSMRMLINYQS